jgi:U3 small nucleolar RNA-associated protein 12
MKPMLERIRGNLRKALRRQKDEMGYNLAALRVISAHMSENTVDYVDDNALAGNEVVSPRKRGFVQVA